jgi:hypothetical protein
MSLYIQIENGQPVNHPAFEHNLIEAFGQVPSNWEPFIRVETPVLDLDLYKFDTPAFVYQKVNGVWTDVFQVIPLNEEELQAVHQRKIEEYKILWSRLPQRDNFSAWVLNEETIKYEPPIPRPTDRDVMWSGANNGWVDKPQKPDDGKTYRLDFYTSSWVEVTQE